MFAFCALLPLAAVAQGSDDDAQALEPIVVTGTRTEHRLDDSPVDVQLITAQDIRRSGARDLAELLELEGGIYATRVAARGSSIEIQGLNSEHVLILVDGRRMIGRINGAIDLTRLRVDAIERVEIVKGPSSALYGADALGGVVNVITKRGDGQLDGSATLRGDSGRNLEAFGNVGWGIGEKVRGQTSAGVFRIRPFDLSDSRPGEDGIDGKSRFASTNVDWDMSERATLGLSGAYSLDDSVRADGGTGGRVYDTRKRIEEVRVGAAPRFTLGDDSALSFDGYYNRYYDQFVQTQRGNSDYLLDEDTLDQLYSLGTQYDHGWSGHRLTLGGEYQYEALDADRLDHQGDRDRESLYAQNEFVLRDTTLRVVPGLRFDRDSQFGQQWSPKLALLYDLGNEWVLRAGYGRGYRAPDFKQLLLRFDNPSVGYRVEGNPDLRPERSSGYNLGATWYSSRSASVSASAFYNRVSDLIEIVQTQSGPPIVFSYRNVSSARLGGIDVQARCRPWDPFELQIGYGWLDARDADTGERLSGRPEHRANALLRYERLDYALQLRGVWIGPRVFNVELDSGGAPTGAGTAKAYAQVDARAEWLRWQNYTLAAGLTNLLDAGDPQYLPIQPRAAYLELGWKFP